MRVIEQPARRAGRLRLVALHLGLGRKRFLAGRSCVAHGARDQARDHVHDHGSAQFPSAENVVADRNLAVRQVLADPLIDALVAPADQHQAAQSGQFLGLVLVQLLALRGKQNDGLAGSSRNAIRARGHAQALDAFKDRFRLEHHTLAAAEGAVIDSAVPVVRKLP